MRKVREILRLHHECRLTQRQVAASTGVSKGTVSAYLRRAHEAGLTWEQARELDDTAVEARLFRLIGRAEMCSASMTRATTSRSTSFFLRRAASRRAAVAMRSTSRMTCGGLVDHRDGVGGEEVAVAGQRANRECRSLTALNAQPTTNLQCKSRIAARKSRPPSPTYSSVVSPAQRWFGSAASKRRSSRFGATADRARSSLSTGTIDGHELRDPLAASAG
jgi:predicted transcriptional regulator